MPLTIGDIANALGDQAAGAYIVGGYLRDRLLGRESRDIDIAMNTDAAAVAKRLAANLGGKWLLLDEDRRIARVLFRSGGEPETQIDLTEFAGDIEDDLARRDFTVDAMAQPLLEAAGGTDAPLIDPFGGRQDLARGIVRAVSDGIFADDSLRLLRAIRLCSELSFELDEATSGAVRRNAALIELAAAERKRDELMRILETERSGAAVYMLDDLGLLGRLLPELSAGRGIEQPKEHYYDVLNHNLQAVVATDVLLARAPPNDAEATAIWREVWQTFDWPPEARERWTERMGDGFSRGALLKLTALLHDVAKPQTRSVEASGRMHFFGHENVGAEMASEIMRRLRFSGQAVRLVATMIEEHLRPLQMAQSGLPSRRALFRYYSDAGDAATDVLFLNLADHIAARGPELNLQRFRTHVALMRYIYEHREEQENARRERLLTGDDLIAELGLPPGPTIGRLLGAIEEAAGAGEIHTREEGLDYARRWLSVREIT